MTVLNQNKEVQLEIWAIPFTEEEARWEEFCTLKQQVKNVRRGLFQRFHELQDKVSALEEELRYLREEKEEKEIKLVCYE